MHLYWRPCWPSGELQLQQLSDLLLPAAPTCQDRSGSAPPGPAARLTGCHIPAQFNSSPHPRPHPACVCVYVHLHRCSHLFCLIGPSGCGFSSCCFCSSGRIRDELCQRLEAGIEKKKKNTSCSKVSFRSDAILLVHSWKSAHCDVMRGHSETRSN